MNNTEIFNKLAKHWPDLYQKSKISSVDVEPGWYNILDTLSGLLSAGVRQARYNLEFAKNKKFLDENDIKSKQKILDTALDELPIIVQIKEKFGGLRFYINNGTEEMENYIRFAESMSLCTCARCGSPGKIRNTGWSRTLCDIHFNKLSTKN